MFIGTPETNTLSQAVVHGLGWQGIHCTDAKGKPARFAILDESGNILEEGADLAREVCAVAITAYRNFQVGNGHLKIFTSPTGIQTIERNNTRKSA